MVKEICKLKMKAYDDMREFEARMNKGEFENDREYAERRCAYLHGKFMGLERAEKEVRRITLKK